MEKIIFVGKELKSLKTSLDLIGNALGEPGHGLPDGELP